MPKKRWSDPARLDQENFRLYRKYAPDLSPEEIGEMSIKEVAQEVHRANPGIRWITCYGYGAKVHAWANRLVRTAHDEEN